MLRAALAVGMGLPLGLCPFREAVAQGGDPKSQRPKAGDRFCQLTLPVSRHAGDPHDLPFVRHERDALESVPAQPFDP